VTDALFVHGAVSASNLLGPGNGWEVGRTEPSQCGRGELGVRDPGATFVDHESAEALRQRRRLRDTAVNPRGRDLYALLGIAPRIPLGNHAGQDEARDSHPKNDSHCCDVSRSQVRTSTSLDSARPNRTTAGWTEAQRRDQVTFRQPPIVVASSFIALVYAWYDGGVSTRQLPIWFARTAGSAANAGIALADESGSVSERAS
jgi:hypothetical protein